MAVDKLVDSAQLDSDLEDVADAIRAKSGGESPLAFPSGFISEIGSIQTGGGGSLPSSISKIDGGTFTFASDTVVTEQITHNLGVVPTGVMVWSDADPYPNFYFGGLFNNPVNNNVLRILGYRSGANMVNNDTYQGTAPIENMLTNEYWSLCHGSYKYTGGITYKWIAWA